jgi:hypothetical protein
MSDDLFKAESGNGPSPFEQIRRVNAAGNEHWSSRDFARVLGYTDYRNFEQVVAWPEWLASTAGSASRIISLISPK